VKFGSAMAIESQANETVCIPGPRGREPKEISVRNLASIIQARMEEIVEHVYYEIKNSGYEKKLIGGIDVTGGGSQLKHITQLFEYITGMDARIGYPTEHLAKGADEVTSPMYSTGVGLVQMGFQKYDKQNRGKSVHIKTHSQKTKGNFFEKIFGKVGKSFFEEDID